MLRALLMSIVAVSLAAFPAVAQTDAPVMGSTATEAVQPGTQAEAKRILVVGDVLGGGLGAGMTRLAEASGEADVTLRFVEESGLARPEVYDWSATLPKVLEGNSYDAVVVLLGTNDRQPIKDGESRLAFGTPEWTDAYRELTDSFLDILAASKAEVYWVSLPPMGDAEFEAAMQQVMAIQKAQAEARGVRFVDIRDAFVGANGAYTDIGPDDTGVVRKLRSSDGITFFKQGNNRMAQLVLAAIRDSVPQPVAASATGEKQDSVRPIPPQVDEATLPVFGQWGADGGAILVVPKDVMIAMSSATSDNFTVGSSTMADLIRTVAPGSSAESLFKLGLAASAPSGRLDDFSLPPAPAE